MGGCFRFLGGNSAVDESAANICASFGWVFGFWRAAISSTIILSTGNAWYQKAVCSWLGKEPKTPPTKDFRSLLEGGLIEL